jgi:hypothetical protein
MSDTKHVSIGFWADQFLRQIHCPVTENNRISIIAWVKAENTKAKWNPLATTRQHADTIDYNATGVKNYLTFSDGIVATAETIRLPFYTKVIQALHSSADPATTTKAIAKSPWGTQQFDISGTRGNLARYEAELLP